MVLWRGLQMNQTRKLIKVYVNCGPQTFSAKSNTKKKVLD